MTGASRPPFPARAIAALMLVALALRLAAAAAVSREGMLFPDERAYHALGMGLAHRGVYGQEGARAAWPPGFPFLLSIVYSLLGEAPHAARALQALLGAAALWPAARLAWAWGGTGAAFWAAAFLALWPHGGAYGALLLTETPAVLLLLGSIAVLEGAIGPRGDLARGALSGGLLGLLALTRASLALLPVPLGIVWAGGLGRRGVRTVAALWLAHAAVVGAWVARNARLPDVGPMLTSKMGSDLYEGVGCEADGGPVFDRIDWDRIVPAGSEGERSRALAHLALADAADDPGHPLRLAPVKWARLWSPWPNVAAWRHPLVAAGTSASLLLWLPLAGWAWFRLPRPARIAWVPALYLTAVHTVFLSSIRYRIPAEGLLAVLSACVLAGARPLRDPTSA